MKKVVDIIWKTIGNFTVNEYIWIIYWSRRNYSCTCICWEKTTATYSQIVLWIKNSCWCLSKVSTHKMSKNRFYRIFHEIKRRCNDKRSTNYNRYWGRWIKLIWSSFEEFKRDMYDSYNEHIKECGVSNTSIERINVNWDYCIENTRRATNIEQANNRRNNKIITINWISKNKNEWQKIYNIDRNTVYSRIKWWMSEIDAITKAVKIYNRWSIT